MKTIQFRETEIKEGERKLTYGDLINICLDRPPSNGWTTSVMKERLDIQDRVTPDVGKIEVTETELEVIKNCVIGFPWAAKHRDLIEFEDYIKVL